MGIIHNNCEIPPDYDILMDKWELKSVTKDINVDKPPYYVFNNTAKVLEKLHYHYSRNSRIVFHSDVDVDGIGTTYIMKKAANNLGSNNHIYIINKAKEHGIQENQVKYFNINKVDLVVITDSSSNEIELIKQFECDVICIDHHDLLHDDLYGMCNDGVHEYIIVNNTIANNNQEEDNLWLRNKNPSAFENLVDYTGDSAMSCGVVVYELMRLYCECFANPKLIENLKLYQWAGITLITDVIDTLNDRNQWYLNNTISCSEMEPSLKIMMTKLNKYKSVIDKTYIGYTFAPVINKAIRAGASNVALSVVLNNPSDIDKLLVYGEIQDAAVNKVLYNTVKNPDTGVETKIPRTFEGESLVLCTDKYEIGLNYNGVIASRLSGDLHKNAAVYITEDGLCRGSFRGKYKGIDYREYFNQYSEDIYAQGHPGAFGFKLRQEQLDYLMAHISDIEPKGEIIPWLTAGNMPVEARGTYHITDFDDFKRKGFLWRIGIGNSKVTSKDEVFIRVRANDVILKENKGKVFTYSVLGMECKAFKALSGSYFDVYPEFTNELSLFIK